MSDVTLACWAIAVPVMRHSRTNATRLVVIVASFVVAREPRVQHSTRAFHDHRTGGVSAGTVGKVLGCRIRFLPVSGGGAIRRDRCGRGALPPTARASAPRHGRPSIGPRGQSRPHAG